MSSSDDAPQGSSLPTPAAAVAELLHVVPRLVDRTRRQADLARSLLGALPCLGGSTGGGATDGAGAVAPAEPEHEQVDVLSVLADDGADVDAIDETPQAGHDAAALEHDTVAPPTESELPIQDYDSLAASQVVPRLATLAPAELKAVQRYEQATRHRQTILHRVAQLLAD
ncbi:MAG: hypothetical protein ACK4V6_15740 [Microthrixaceae bacterium]